MYSFFFHSRACNWYFLTLVLKGVCLFNRIWEESRVICPLSTIEDNFFSFFRYTQPRFHIYSLPPPIMTARDSKRYAQINRRGTNVKKCMAKGKRLIFLLKTPKIFGKKNLILDVSIVSLIFRRFPTQT